MKKLLASALALTTALSLAACGSGSQGIPGEKMQEGHRQRLRGDSPIPGREM